MLPSILMLAYLLKIIGTTTIRIFWGSLTFLICLSEHYNTNFFESFFLLFTFAKATMAI